MTIALIAVATLTALAVFLVVGSAKRNPGRDWHTSTIRSNVTHNDGTPITDREAAALVALLDELQR